MVEVKVGLYRVEGAEEWAEMMEEGMGKEINIREVLDRGVEKVVVRGAYGTKTEVKVVKNDQRMGKGGWRSG